MSRVVHLSLDEGVVVIRCLSEKVGISAIETLPRGGVRLVCMSNDGAVLIRRKLKAYVLDGAVTRARHRPATPSPYQTAMQHRSKRTPHH
jgi:hypothetical protein